MLVKQKGKSRMENQGKLTRDTRQTKTNKTKHNKICVGHQHTQDTRRRQTKRNITQYVLDTTISKQAQAT